MLLFVVGDLPICQDIDIGSMDWYPEDWFRALSNHVLDYCPRCERGNPFYKVHSASRAKMTAVPMDFHYSVRISVIHGSTAHLWYGFSFLS